MYNMSHMIDRWGKVNRHMQELRNECDLTHSLLDIIIEKAKVSRMSLASSTDNNDFQLDHLYKVLREFSSYLLPIMEFNDKLKVLVGTLPDVKEPAQGSPLSILSKFIPNNYYHNYVKTDNVQFTEKTIDQECTVTPVVLGKIRSSDDEIENKVMSNSKLNINNPSVNSKLLQEVSVQMTNSTSNANKSTFLTCEVAPVELNNDCDFKSSHATGAQASATHYTNGFLKKPNDPCIVPKQLNSKPDDKDDDPDHAGPRKDALTDNVSTEIAKKPQYGLEIGEYKCIISHACNPNNFFIMPESMFDHYYLLIKSLTDFCNKNPKETFRSKEDACTSKIKYCAFNQNNLWHRGKISNNLTKNPIYVEIYNIDSGAKLEVRYDSIQPLHDQFWDVLQMAYPCHLAGVFSSSTNRKFTKATQKYMKNLVNSHCSIHVKDNTSSSLAVELTTEDGVYINEDIVKPLGYSFEELSLNGRSSTSSVGGLLSQKELFSKSASFENSFTELNSLMEEQAGVLLEPMGQEEEHANLSMALQGFVSTDEAETCRFYKGPPATSCFKGSTCKKKHVLLNPSGWTNQKCLVLPRTFEEEELPPPGSVLSVRIISVLSHNMIFVHILNENNGMNSLPNPLMKLILSMNSEGCKSSNRDFQVLPSMGQLVSVFWSKYNNWQRATVISHLSATTIKVFYVDFGHFDVVTSENVVPLQAQFAILPVQAKLCTLANAHIIPGITVEAVTSALSQLILNKTLKAFICSISSGDMAIKLFDENNKDIVKILSENGLMQLTPYK